MALLKLGHMLDRFLFLASLALLSTLRASGQAVNEHQMKAAYLYNVAKFVEWPEGAFKNAADPVSFCVAGQSPIQNSLEEALKAETIDSRNLHVRHVAEDDSRGCHILFVGASERKRFRTILRDCQNSYVLTVGEADGFLEEGGAINFKLEGGKLHIEINMTAVSQQRLRISPRLLSLARVVK